MTSLPEITAPPFKPPYPTAGGRFAPGPRLVHVHLRPVLHFEHQFAVHVHHMVDGVLVHLPKEANQH